MAFRASVSASASRPSVAGELDPRRAVAPRRRPDERPPRAVGPGHGPWSCGLAAILIPALLRAAAGGCPPGSRLQEVWGALSLVSPGVRLLPPRRSDPSAGYFDGDLPAVLHEPGLTLAGRLARSFEERPAGEEERQSLLGGLREVVTDRVRTILREKRAGEYAASALLAAAVAEALALTGRTTEAKRVRTGLLVEFPRHRLFREELARVVARSPVLEESRPERPPPAARGRRRGDPAAVREARARS